MAKSRRKAPISRVEAVAARMANEEFIYRPTEKIRTIVVENFPALGKLAALRFLEWAQHNQGRTIALPTGKTPEHFIKWVGWLLSNWEEKKAIKLLEEFEVDPGKKPDMSSFHFVQIDEFYPINSWQHNSFYHYVNKYYIEPFGLDADKALLIDPNAIGLLEGETLDAIWPGHLVDLSLRTRVAHNDLEERQQRVLREIDQWCTEYESKIRALGGIGFFLGGIGPDGHIGFNVRGSDHYSTTRLAETNYETQAAAASDLGGIEISRNRLVITIGLQTIVYSPDTTAIIIAAGEAKAGIVRTAIESEKANEVPGSILQDLPGAAFYITHGAAKLLTERSHLWLSRKPKLDSTAQFNIVSNCSLSLGKKVTNLTEADIRTHRSGDLLLKSLPGSLESFVEEIDRTYKQRIDDGMNVRTDEVFLHTAPHHDDIMLAYMPYLVRLMREQSNVHYFNYLTSGFNAVTNRFMHEQTENAKHYIARPDFKQLIKDGYFEPQNVIFRNRDTLQYLDGLAASNPFETNEGTARRFLRNLVEIYGENSAEELQTTLDMLTEYFRAQYPGKKDRSDIQRLKGMVREWEADVLWGYFGFGAESVIHSRLGFYKGDIFTEEPEMNRDVLPVLETLKRVKPTVVTVALDPEGSGPDTHYKVLQAISTALKLYIEEEKDAKIEVWGYRNVWYRYHPSEANLFVPVTFNAWAIAEDSFLNSFLSQAEASFPSYQYDGPFSGLAKRIQVEQYRFMKTILGRDFFYRSPDSRIRSTRGLVYLKVMNLGEFFQTSRELRKSTENA